MDVDGFYAGVEIYLSETVVWIYKESEWGEDTDRTFYRQPSVFLNDCLYIMGHFGEYFMILAVDMEGNTWRQIDRPRVFNTSCISLGSLVCMYYCLSQ